MIPTHCRHMAYPEPGPSLFPTVCKAGVRFADTEEAFEEAARQRLGPDAGDEAVAEAIAAARAVADTEPVAHRAVADARREWRVWQRILKG